MQLPSPVSAGNLSVVRGRWIVWLVVVVAAGVVVSYLGVSTHLFHYLAAHGAAIVTGLGAFATAAGVAAGAVLALLYGRKGSASVSATAYQTTFGVVVAARPCVKAVGLFRVTFKRKEGVTLRLAEVHMAGGELVEGRCWDSSGAFGQQYVDAGEELTTTVVFAPVTPTPSMVGWLVYLNAGAPSRLAKFRTSWWADQVFVPCP